MVSRPSEEGSEADFDLSLHLSDCELDEFKDAISDELEDKLLEDPDKEPVTMNGKEDNTDIDKTVEDNITTESKTNGDVIEASTEARIDEKDNDSTSMEEVDLVLEAEPNDDAGSINDFSLTVESENNEDDTTQVITQSDDLKEEENSPQNTIENKDDASTDLLLVMDEKDADVDETEYNKSVIEDQENEDDEMKENTEPSSKSPSPSLNNEESLDKTDCNPDELMDIGDNVVNIDENEEIGVEEDSTDTAEQADTPTPTLMGEDQDLELETEGTILADVIEEENIADIPEDVIMETEVITLAPIEGLLDNSVAQDEEVTSKEKDANDSASEILNSLLEKVLDDVDSEEKIKTCSEDDLDSEKKRKSCSSTLSTKELMNTDSDSNKENVMKEETKSKYKSKDSLNEEETTSEVKSGITTRGSIRKRLSEEEVSLEDSSKKFKPDPSLNKNSFKQFMLDKSLKGLTREQLEMFVLEKICESLTYKNKVIELRKILREREATIEALRKDVIVVGKQAKDMNIVHEKILLDLQRFKKNPDRPLQVPRITRSVGLQATTRESDLILNKRDSAANPTTKSYPNLLTDALANSRPVANKGITNTKPQQSPPKMPKPSTKPSPKVPPKPSPKAPAKPVTQKPTVTVRTPPRMLKTAVPSKTPVRASVSPQKPVEKSPAASGASFIDLTSDDERKAPASSNNQLQRLPNGTKVVHPPNGHKFVMVNGQSVMVKLAPPGNYIMNSNGMKIITTSGTTVKPVQSSVLKATSITNSNTTYTTTNTTVPPATIIQRQLVRSKRPPPFPNTPPSKPCINSKPIPPRPFLSLSKTVCGTGIILSWKISAKLELFEEIASYQIFAYQETNDDPNPESWNKIGDVKALRLPMAVTLTHFAPGNRYYFAVRAVDVLARLGPFSDYHTI